MDGTVIEYSYKPEFGVSLTTSIVDNTLIFKFKQMPLNNDG